LRDLGATNGFGANISGWEGRGDGGLESWSLGDEPLMREMNFPSALRLPNPAMKNDKGLLLRSVLIFVF
jgi:hypothetical protein